MSNIYWVIINKHSRDIAVFHRYPEKIPYLFVTRNEAIKSNRGDKNFIIKKIRIEIL